MSASNPVADSIRHSITKNGYPEKVVRLPFKPVYDSCKKNDTALADVLDQLPKEENILGVDGRRLHRVPLAGESGGSGAG